jgi:predicted nucleotidyltransferase
MVKKPEKESLKKKLKPYYLPLTKLKEVRLVIAYGSAVTKGVEKGHDIDLLVVFDDLAGEAEKGQAKIKFLAKLLTEKAKREEITLHFQSPKSITFWWELVKKGEPWIISAIKEAVSLYDPCSYLHHVKRLLKEDKIYSLDEKAERLLFRAIKKIVLIREELLVVPIKLLEISTNVAQILLSYFGVFTASANKTKDKLVELKKELNIEEGQIKNYEELIKMNEKIAHGTLSEFSGYEVDLWLERAEQFIAKSELALLGFEQKQQEQKLKESYDYGIALCSRALKLVGKVPESDSEKIDSFKKNFVDTGYIPKEYHEAMQSLYECVKENKKLKIQFDKLYLKGLEFSVSELTRKLEAEGKLRAKETQELKAEEVTKEKIAKELAVFVEAAIKNKEVKAIWAISREKEALIAVLIDDTKLAAQGLKELELKIFKEAEKSERFLLRPALIKITDWLDQLMQDKLDVFAEIKAAISLYDPSGFFMPFKRLVEDGKIHGTREFLLGLLLAAKQTLKEVRDSKFDVISILYESVISAAQAAMLAREIVVLNPQKIPEELQKFARKKELSEKTISDYLEIIRTYKDFEHNIIKDVKGKELDQLIKQADMFISKMQDIATGEKHKLTLTS